MLSILIPTYNFNIVDLVKTLHQQCEQTQIPFEILCFDDGSKLPYKKANRSIQSLQHVYYQELPTNIGRARIRNLLGKTAKYTYLLFMDNDSKVIKEAYISNYIQYLNSTTLLYGGRVYAKTKPKNSQLSLHYTFGKNREESSTKKRQITPYNSFMTNNFLVPKDIFLAIQFEESIQGYGHEDTLFGIALQKREVKILHLDNPLVHIGLEEQSIFLRKQQTAIKNLYQLHQKEPLLKTKLLTTYIWCKKWKIQGLLFSFLKVLKPIIDYKLKAIKPNLFYLDLYKLHYLLQIDKNGINNLQS